METQLGRKTRQRSGEALAANMIVTEGSDVSNALGGGFASHVAGALAGSGVFRTISTIRQNPEMINSI